MIELHEGRVLLLHSMALTLHQSGHGHSHGGLGSKGHSHKTPERSSDICNGAVDAEQNAARTGASLLIIISVQHDQSQ